MNAVTAKEIEDFQDGAYVYNQDPSADYSNMHQHNKGQFEYAEGGMVNVFIDGKLWYLPSRHFLWIPPNTPHHTISRSKQVEFYTFYFPMPCDSIEKMQHPGIFSVDELLRSMILHTKGWNGWIDPTSNMDQFYFIMAILSLLKEKITSLDALPFQQPLPNNDRIKEITDYLKKNLHKSEKVESVARRFGMSPRNMSRLFRDSMGMSYIHYLQSIRLTRSMELLVDSNFNINEIARKVGYDSVPSFSNMFYHSVGVRPTEYVFKR